MKAHLTRMLKGFPVQPHHQPTETQAKKLQADNIMLERALREKDREIDQLRHQLENAQARLQDLRGTDDLTGLPNRHVFKEHLTHSLKRAVRLGYSLSLMLVDIDHLREVNLRYGYEVGDQVLIEVSQILKNSVREIDVPARWGGEELVAVLHETDAEGAYVVAERVRKKVSMLEIKDPKTDRPISITTSLAVASYPSHASDPQSLLAAVCEAMLTAKGKGCNSCIIANR